MDGVVPLGKGCAYIDSNYLLGILKQRSAFMVKIRKGQKLFALVIVCFTALLVTCKGNIGLGGSIDINPPKIDRIYPPIGAVIKGGFIFAVEATDDTSVTAVTATILDSEGKQVDFFDLKNSGSNSWRSSLNTRSENGYPLKDGSYTVQIIARDSSEKTVRGESAFIIDNTPPLLILSRPSTAAESSVDINADIFGDKFSLKGQIYEKNDVEKLTITAKDAEGNPKGDPAVLYNVPQSLNVTVDSFFGSTATPSFYRSVYGSDVTKAKQQYSYTITLSDSAREYTDPSKTVGTGEGNSTSTYYLYNDLYQMLNESRYKPAEIYEMMQAGIYGTGTVRSATGEKNAPWTTAKVVEFLQKPEVKIGSGGNRNGTFSLNPSINPKYGIEGFSPHQIDTNVTAPITSSEYDVIYTGSKINIKLSTNFDEDPLNATDQYEFYLIKADTDAELRSLVRNSFDVNKDTDLYSDPAAKTLKSNIQRLVIPPGNIKASGSNYVATVVLENLPYTSYYILQVRGCDQNSPEHTMTADPKDKKGGHYIFRMQKNGAKPEVSVSQINGKASQAGRFYIKDGEAAAFDVALKNTGKGKVTIELIGSSGNSISLAPELKQQLYQKTGENELSVHFEIAKEYFAEKNAGYRVTVQANDENGNGSSNKEEYQLYYDAAGPVISANVSGTVTQMPNITGDIYDAGAGVDYASLSAAYTYNGGTENPLTFHKNPTAADNKWELDSPTNGEGRYKITLTAKDTLGNTATKELEFIYDSANPAITSVNTKTRDDLKKTPTIIGGAVDSDNKHYIDISGTITEANGIKSITVDGSDVDITGTSPHYTFTYWLKKDTDWSSTSPIAIVVTDNADKTDRIDLNVTIDTEAPAFTLMTVGDTENITSFPIPPAPATSATSSSHTVSVKGELKDLGSGVDKVVAQWEVSSNQKTAEFPAIPKNSNGIYSIDGALALGVPVNTIIFKAYDKAGKSSDQWHATVSVTNIKIEFKDIELIPGTGELNPPYMAGGVPYITKSFTLKVEGIFAGATSQNFTLKVTKDGEKVDVSNILNPTVTPNTGITISPSSDTDTITGLKSGYKSGSTYFPQTYQIACTIPSNADGRYVFTVASGDVQRAKTLCIDTHSPSITPIQPQAGSSISKNAHDAAGKLSATMFDSAEINSKSARAYYRKKTGASPAASAYQDLTAAEGYIALSGTPLTGFFADAEKWNGTLYAAHPDKAAHNGNPVYTTPAATTIAAVDEITEGEYEVWFGAQDNLNQLTTTTPVTVVYDTATPTVTLEVKPHGASNYAPMGELYTNDTFNVKVVGKDSNDIKAITLERTQDGTTWTDTNITRDTTNTTTAPSPRLVTRTDEYTVAFTAGQEGAYTLRAVVTDKADKQAVATCSVVYDNKRPTLTVPKDPLTGGTQVGTTYWIKTETIQIKLDSQDDPALGANKASGIEQVACSIGSSPRTVITTNSGEKTATVSPSTDGVTFYATDKAGNEDSKTLDIKSDMTPPTLTVTTIKRQGDAGNGTANLSAVQYLKADAKLDIQYKAADETGGSGVKPNSVTVKIKDGITEKHSLSSTVDNAGNGSATINMALLSETALPDKDYTVELSVEDNAGNSSTVQKFNIKVDRQKPVITMVTPAPDSKHEHTDSAVNWAKSTRLFGKLQIAGAFSDMGSGMRYEKKNDSNEQEVKFTYILGKNTITPEKLIGNDSFEPLGNGTWALKIANAEKYCETNKYLLERYNENDTINPSGSIYKIPLHLKMEDNAGNVADETFYIMIDSSGKTPVIDIQAPDQSVSADTDANKAYGGFEVITVGGSVQFSGLVQTANPAAGKIEKVYAKFSPTVDSDGNLSGSFSANFKAYEEITAVPHDLAAGVTIASGGNLKKWSFTAETDAMVTAAGSAAVAAGRVELYYQIGAKNDATPAQTKWSSVRKLIFDKNYPYATKQVIKRLKEGKKPGDAEADAYPAWTNPDDPSDTNPAVYVNNIKVKDGDMLECELLSVNDIGKITIKSATKGASYINAIGTKEGQTALGAVVIPVEKTGSGTPVNHQVFTKITNGYRMRLPIKVTDLEDSHQLLNVEITIFDTTNPPKQNFVQFNLKYDKTAPAVIFGSPVGTIGTGLFSATRADNISAAKAGMSTENLFVFVETKDGLAKTIPVTAIGDKYITYNDAGDIFSNSSSMYVLVRKNPIVYNSIGSGKWQLQGFAYDTDTGVEHVTATLGATSHKINTFTPELGNFCSFVHSIDTSALLDGKTTLKLSVQDYAKLKGNTGDMDVYIRNKPLKLKKVSFATDLNGDENYSNDTSTSRYEEITVAGNSQYVSNGTGAPQDQQNYIQKGIDIHETFSFKNKEHSQITFELEGGQGTAYPYEVYKADTNGDKTGNVLKSGTLTDTGVKKVMGFTAADFAADKIPEGDNQQFVIVLKETGVVDSSRELRLTVMLNVKTKDTSKPQVTVLPFYWNGEGNDDAGTPRNSLPDGDRTKGHIEITAVSGGGGISDVSGTVILRGTAYHATRLESVELEIPHVSPNPTVSYSNGTWTPSNGLSLSDERLDLNGHWVTWEYTWNTGTPALAETIKVTAIRKEGTTTITSPNSDHGNDLVQHTATRSDTQSMTLAAGDTARKGQFIRLFEGDESYLITVNTATKLDNNQVTVSWEKIHVPQKITAYCIYPVAYENDGITPSYNRASVKLNVVPYITGVRTALSKLGGNNDPDMGARTALGHYPVSDGEKIKIHGFNLAGAAYTVGGVPIPAGNVSGTESPWDLTLPANALSGKLTAAVGGIEASNNKNTNTKDYNKAKKTANNDTLTDDVELDVWQFNSDAVKPANGQVSDAVMKINPVKGFVGFAFANGADLFSMPSKDISPSQPAKSYKKRQRNWDDYGSVGFAYGSDGTAHAVAAARDTNYDNYFTTNDKNVAGPFTYFSSTSSPNGTQPNEGYSGTGGERLESIGVIFPDAPMVTVKGYTKQNPTINKQRIQSPSFAISNAGVYLAYYDKITEQIRFRHKAQLNGTSVANRPTAPDYDNGKYSLIAGGSTGNSAGNFVSIAVKPGATEADDVVVAVWYTGDDLVYAYKTQPANDNDASSSASATPSAGNWSKPVTIFENAGEYCQVAVDKDGGVHIAAFHSNEANLLYAFMSSYNAAEVQTCTVDSHGIVGTNITLDVAYSAIGGKPVPYIGYYADSAMRPKLAYLVVPDTIPADFTQAPAGSDENGKMSGKWEIAFVPTSGKPEKNRVNVGVWKDASGVIKDSKIAGTVKASSSNASDGEVYGNGTKNPILGYVIRKGTVETAQKK